MQPRLPVLQVHSQHPQQPQIPHRSAPRPGPACCPSNSPLTPHSPNTSTSSSLTVILNSVRRDRTRDDGKLLSHFSILSAARNLLRPPRLLRAPCNLGSFAKTAAGAGISFAAPTPGQLSRP